MPASAPFSIRQLTPADVPLIEPMLTMFGEAFADADTYTAAPPRTEYTDKADGRWHRAYKSGKDMTIPADLQAAIDAEPRAKSMLATLSAQNR